MRQNRSNNGSEGDEDARAHVTTDLSMRQLLAGFFEKCGGPQACGEVLADIFMDENNNTTLRVRTADIVTRLLGQHVTEDTSEGLETPEQIEEEMRRIAAK